MNKKIKLILAAMVSVFIIGVIFMGFSSSIKQPCNGFSAEEIKLLEQSGLKIRIGKAMAIPSPSAPVFEDAALIHEVASLLKSVESSWSVPFPESPIGDMSITITAADGKSLSFDIGKNFVYRAGGCSAFVSPERILEIRKVLKR